MLVEPALPADQTAFALHQAGRREGSFGSIQAAIMPHSGFVLDGLDAPTEKCYSTWPKRMEYLTKLQVG